MSTPVPPSSRSRDRWSLATVALLLGAALLVAGTFRDYGATWDECFQQELGRDVVAWFSSGGADGRALSGGSPGNLHLYGPVFEAAAELAGRALPFDPVETRHLLGALVGLIGVVGTALLARRLGGPRAGLFGALLLLTTPFWWGYGFGNSKDIPFAAAYPWFLLALLRMCDGIERPSTRRVVAAGAALGAGLAVRPGGLILLLPMALGIVSLRVAPVLRQDRAPGRVAMATLLQLVALIGVGWLLMLVAWPYGLTRPISGPLEAVEAARRFPWNGLVRFAGAWYPSTALPRSYAPVWFLSTLPESWLAVAAVGGIGGALAWRRGLRPRLEPSWLDPVVVAVAGFGPIAAVVVSRPVLYDGIRHLLFVVPALAAAGGWAFSAALEALPRWGARAAVGVTGALALLAVADAVRLHPYQYVYFNRAVAGGLSEAGARFELDYWGAAGREAMEWVVRNVEPGGGGPTTVATTADPFTAYHWIEADPSARARFDFASVGPPDLKLATTRWFDHRSTGRVLHVVERMGVPLLYVIGATPGAAPLVLEGGDAAVSLPAADGWWGSPSIGPGARRAAYVLRREGGAPAEIDAEVWTQGNGGVPGLDELREVVAALAGPGARDPVPILGPAAAGWEVDGGAGAMSSAVAAVRTGGAALVLRARFVGAQEESSRELIQWLRGVRPSEEIDRRRP